MRVQALEEQVDGRDALARAARVIDSRVGQRIMKPSNVGMAQPLEAAKTCNLAESPAQELRSRRAEHARAALGSEQLHAFRSVDLAGAIFDLDHHSKRAATNNAAQRVFARVLGAATLINRSAT